MSRQCDFLRRRQQAFTLRAGQVCSPRAGAVSARISSRCEPYEVHWRRWRWQVRGWWQAQRRRVVVTLALGLLCLLIGAAGGGSWLDEALRQAAYLARGERATTQSVVVVTLDEVFAEARGPAPYEAALIEELVGRVEGDGARLVAVYAGAGLAWGEAQTVRGCSDAVLYYAEVRPRWLGSGCEFWRLTPEELEPGPRARVWREGGARTLVGYLAERAGYEVGARDAVGVNFSGGMPRLSGANLEEAGFVEGLFRGRVVFVVPDVPGGVERAGTPYGEVAREVVRAEAVATIADDAGLMQPPGQGPLGLVLGLLAGAWAATRRASLLRLAGALMLAWGAVFAGLYGGLAIQGAGLVVGALVGFAVVHFVPATRRARGREVQALLANAVKEATSRRGGSAGSGEAFWSELLARAGAVLGVETMSLGELGQGSWWISFRAHLGLDDDAIAEMRRDVRRSPYRQAYERRSLQVVRGYVREADLETVMVPLVVRERVVGFWMLHTPSAAAFVEARRAAIERVARQLADEIVWRWMEHGVPEVMAREMDRADAMVGAALAAMEHLELDRRALEDVSENAQVGLMLANLFGEVTFENEAMRRLLEGQERGQGGIYGLIARHSEEDETSVARRIDEVLSGGEAQRFRWEPDEEGGRLVEICVSAVWREEMGRRVVRGLVLTALDVSSAVEGAREKLNLIRVVNTRAADLLSVVSGYTNVLSMSSGLGTAERTLVEGLEEAIAELGRVVDDFQGVLKPPQDVQATMPLSVQYVVREALRGASTQTELTGVRVDVPTEPMIARGHPESIQKAIRLMIQDSAELVPDQVQIEVTVHQEGEQTRIRVHVPNVMIPTSLLQRLLEGGEGDVSGGNRLFLARQYVQGSGGRLEAHSELDGLTYDIILPKGR